MLPLPLLFHTVRHLRAEQVLYRLLRQVPRPARPLDLPQRARAGTWSAPVAWSPARLWKPSRLRDYTLQYHFRPARALIENWIQCTPPGQGTGWEPYPLSLRLMNWIKWILSGETPSLQMLASAAGQADFLFRNLEYHLLGNHLFMNAAALVFAGTFFQQDAWLRQGITILEREIAEQVLEDGGHFERSPMYHSLALETLLDLVNLGRAYPGLLPDWVPCVARMLGWLRQMSHPDGEIAFFNDATFEVAPEPRLLFAYAARLGVAADQVALTTSGYIRLQNADTVVLFDAAPIGPDYQPGHAHADTLSFELSHCGRRVLVNSGTSTYEAGQQRSWERGTMAHNTVAIDGENSSQVWAAFRVARRAYPRNIRTYGKAFAEAAHDGYQRLKPPVIHRRRLELQERCLRVTDSIEGEGEHEVAAFFHLHPGAGAEIELDAKFRRQEVWTTYHPGFGLSFTKPTIIGCYWGPCPVLLESRILLD